VKTEGSFNVKNKEEKEDVSVFVRNTEDANVPLVRMSEVSQVRTGCGKLIAEIHGAGSATLTLRSASGKPRVVLPRLSNHVFQILLPATRSDPGVKSKKGSPSPIVESWPSVVRSSSSRILLLWRGCSPRSVLDSHVFSAGPKTYAKSSQSLLGS
jgi:hypothetical protein